MNTNEQDPTETPPVAPPVPGLTAETARAARDRRTQLFLKRVQDATVAARKSTVRLRIQPQIYDAVKNVYVAWPDRGWNVNLNGVLDAEPILALMDQLVDLLGTEGVAGTAQLLAQAGKKRTK